MLQDIERIPIKKIGNLIIDLQCFSIKFNDKVVYLQDKEMRLLCLMVDHPQWIFTKNQIFDIIYEEKELLDLDAKAINNRIYCLIRNLRNKLKIGSKHSKFIQTIHGVGYKFVIPKE